MIKLSKIHHNQKGILVVSVTIALTALSVVAMAVIAFALGTLQSAQRQTYITSALNAADSGVDRALAEANDAGSCYNVTNATLSNTSSRQVIYSVSTTGPSCPTNVDVGTEVKSTGKVLSPAGNLLAERTVVVALKNNSEFPANIQTGPGGLIMGGNAVIASGNVKIGGYIDFTTGTASQIGTPATPVNVDVAHTLCPDPADSTYPAQCTTADIPSVGYPIEPGGGFAPRIYGEVCATNQGTQYSGRFTQPGITDPNCVADPVQIPDYDREAHKNAAIAAYPTPDTGSDAGCNSGIKTWPENYRISGDVSIGSACTVVVEGNTWITGRLTVRGTIVTDASVTTHPVIMVDGLGASGGQTPGLEMRGSGKFIANASGIGSVVITYWNSLGDPDAAPTGSDLASSVDIETIDIAGAANASTGTVFFSRWSLIDVGGGVSVGSLIGQTISMRGNGSISFGGQLFPISTYWSAVEYKKSPDHLP